MLLVVLCGALGLLAYRYSLQLAWFSAKLLDEHFDEAQKERFTAHVVTVSSTSSPSAWTFSRIESVPRDATTFRAARSSNPISCQSSLSISRAASMST